jgi:hypothetical protein
VRFEEFLPGRLSLTLRNGIDPMLSEDVPDRGVGDLVAQAGG